MPNLRSIGLLAAVLVFVAGCKKDDSKRFHTSFGSVFRSWNPTGVQKVKDVPIADFKAELQRQLATRPDKVNEEQWGHVKELYKGYLNAPLWMDEDGLNKHRADDLLDAITNATDDAIQIDQYALFALASALDTLRRPTAPTAAQLARADLLLTTSYASLAEDYLTGQVSPNAVGNAWHTAPEEEKVDSALARTLRDKDLTDSFVLMRPQGAEYEALRLKMLEYRKLVAAGGWGPIPDGKALKRGDRDDPARLQALRTRLQAEGITVPAPDSAGANLYDQALAAGVAQFQRQHAIVADGQLGKETADAMSVPAQFRLTQIAANLERHRWLPHALGEKYIMVNVPAFRLEGYENGQKTIEMKVIVGADYEGRATPVFSDKMEYVVFRPYWDVPPNIAENEFTNGVPADFDVSVQNGKTHLRQRPGPSNALGLAKFIFPNDFNVYLHDTPNDNLFKQDVRAFSHGCIRLEQPAELAQWVLGWDAARVQAAMNGADDRTVKLPARIPVYIAYFTAYTRDGQVWFGNDLYGRDTQLAGAVAGAAVPSPEAVRAVTQLRQLLD
jgi:L,D-transpeptidase YcbB